MEVPLVSGAILSKHHSDKRLELKVISYLIMTYCTSQLVPSKNKMNYESNNSFCERCLISGLVSKMKKLPKNDHNFIQ